MEIKIEQIKTFHPELTAKLNNLLKQLDSDPRLLNDKHVIDIVQNKNNRFFVAKESGGYEIIGMLTLVVIHAPSVRKGSIEDVVVDSSHRRMGIGKKLIFEAIKQAQKEGVCYIDLTSRPMRKEANSLYQKLGFQKRDTNVYRLKIQH